VIVAFEEGDLTRPVVMGALPGAGDVWTLPGGSTLRIDRQSGDLAVEHASGASVTLTTAGCSVRSPATVVIEAAAAVEVGAGMTKLVSSMVEASNVLKADTVIANNVVASSYTPGAGNVW
jgi:phage baseplate assembly protein gpV